MPSCWEPAAGAGGSAVIPGLNSRETFRLGGCGFRRSGGWRGRSPPWGPRREGGGLQTGHHWRPQAAACAEVQQDTWWLGPRSRPVCGWGVPGQQWTLATGWESAPPGWGWWALHSFTEARCHSFHILSATIVPESVPWSWNSGSDVETGTGTDCEKEPVEPHG